MQQVFNFSWEKFIIEPLALIENVPAKQARNQEDRDHCGRKPLRVRFKGGHTKDRLAELAEATFDSVNQGE